MTNLLNSSDILSQDNIVGLIGDIAKAHVRRYKKSSHIPMRSVEWSVDQRSAYISMPALSNELGLYIVKSATFFKRAPNEKLPAIISNVTAYDARTGNFLAVLDGNALTELKCAAISAYVSDFFPAACSQHLFYYWGW